MSGGTQQDQIATKAPESGGVIKLPPRRRIVVVAEADGGFLAIDDAQGGVGGYWTPLFAGEIDEVLAYAKRALTQLRGADQCS